MKMFSWFRKDGSIERILKQQKKLRKGRYLPEDLDDVLFLDYDGVVNIDPENFGRDAFDHSCMENVNILCRRFGLKIVVISSWKHYPNRESILYDSGLDPEIRIMGMTETLKTREEEIKAYLLEHPSIRRFLILDDHRHLGDLKKYQVLTEWQHGFTEEKLMEALRLYCDLWKVQS